LSTYLTSRDSKVTLWYSNMLLSKPQLWSSYMLQLMIFIKAVLKLCDPKLVFAGYSQLEATVLIMT